jgi:predicted membrane metal-binding protein
LGLITALLFGGANFLSRRFHAPSWPVWLLGVASSLVVFAALALALGPTTEARRILIRRLRAMAHGVRHPGVKAA